MKWIAHETVVIRQKEIKNKAYWIYRGCLGIYVNDTRLFGLNEGSWVNFVNWVMGYNSIFAFVAEGETVILELSEEDLKENEQTNMELKEVLDGIRSHKIVVGEKYDFQWFVEDKKIDYESPFGQNFNLSKNLKRTRVTKSICKCILLIY
jgi:signal-transduction protein with cAMP-binding, CBS, and nucleotidyltransferase domain